MKRADITALARDALILRRWALRVIATPFDSPGARRYRCPDVAPRAWELFLRAEHCALPLSRQIVRFSHDLPADAARMLAAIALEETQRVVSARAQLRRVSQWADSHNTTVVILKGAVAAGHDETAVDLSDIDLWIRPGTEGPLLEWLGNSGHSPKKHAAQHHHASRLTDQLVAVEVHHTIPYANLEPGWESRTLPLAHELPRLHRLDPADHLWHVLIHASIQHIDRRGRLRDLLLISHASSLCSDRERDLVRHRATTHHAADALHAMLRMAEAIAARCEPEDAFTTVAAARYLDTASGPRHPTVRFLFSNAATTAALYGIPGCKHHMAKVLTSRDSVTPMPGLRWFQRRSPRVGGAVVLGLRIIKRAASLVFAVPRAHAARRLVRALITAP